MRTRDVSRGGRFLPSAHPVLWRFPNLSSTRSVFLECVRTLVERTANDSISEMLRWNSNASVHGGDDSFRVLGREQFAYRKVCCVDDPDSLAMPRGRMQAALPSRHRHLRSELLNLNPGAARSSRASVSDFRPEVAASIGLDFARFRIGSRDPKKGAGCRSEGPSSVVIVEAGVQLGRSRPGDAGSEPKGDGRCDSWCWARPRRTPRR